MSSELPIQLAWPPQQFFARRVPSTRVSVKKTLEGWLYPLTNTRFKVQVHILCHVSSIRHVNLGINWILTSSVFQNEPQKSIWVNHVNGCQWRMVFPHKNPPLEVTSNEHTVFTWYVVISVVCNMAQLSRIMSDWKGCRNYVYLKMRGPNVQQDFLNRKKLAQKQLTILYAFQMRNEKKQQSTCKCIYKYKLLNT